MQADQNPAKPDNLFGVCHALGEDFGFNPLWLRLGFGVALLFNLEWTIGVYLALGVIVLASRLLVRSPKAAVKVARARSEPWAPRTPRPAADVEYEPLRKAA